MSAESDISSSHEIRNHKETVATRPFIDIAKTFVFLVLEAMIRPRWASYRARGFYYNYHKNESHKTHLEAYDDRSQALYDAVGSITDRSTRQVAEADRGVVIDGMRVVGDWVVDIPGASQSRLNVDDGPIKLHYCARQNAAGRRTHFGSVENRCFL